MVSRGKRMDVKNESETIKTEAPVSIKAVTGTCAWVGITVGHLRCQGTLNAVWVVHIAMGSACIVGADCRAGMLSGTCGDGARGGFGVGVGSVCVDDAIGSMMGVRVYRIRKQSLTSTIRFEKNNGSGRERLLEKPH
eukprot:scpid90593/ scgid12269/ 